MKRQESGAGYFEFSRKDRIALGLIALAIGSGLLLPAVLERTGAHVPVAADTAWIAAIRRLELADSGQTGEGRTRPTAFLPESRPLSYELFPFDPNTLTSEGWQKLGLRDKTIRTILNYLAKGGSFRKPEDLERIYGLRPEEFARIAPYIRIKIPAPAGTPPPSSTAVPAERKPRAYQPIDINTADTSAFIALPGIGSKLAARIVAFRERLGGFYSIEQVREVYGIADSVFEKIRPLLMQKSSAIKKLPINTADEATLKAHPYLRQSARAIVNYRAQHGVFKKPEDLLNVAVLTEEMISKLVPYLEF